MKRRGRPRAEQTRFVFHGTHSAFASDIEEAGIPFTTTSADEAGIEIRQPRHTKGVRVRLVATEARADAAAYAAGLMISRLHLEPRGCIVTAKVAADRITRDSTTGRLYVLRLEPAEIKVQRIALPEFGFDEGPKVVSRMEARKAVAASLERWASLVDPAKAEVRSRRRA